MTTALRFIVTLVLAQAGLAPRVAAAEPLSDVTKIRSLSREDAAQGLLVKLSGVVVYTGWEDFVMHDGKASIFVDFQFAQKQGVWKSPMPNLRNLAPGTAVEVEGVTDPGGFSPMVLVAKYRTIGPQTIPPPERPTTEQLLSSSHDSRWVEVEGVVRKYEAPRNGLACVTLLVGGHPCPVLLSKTPRLSDKQLVDAKIRVRGVLLNIANLRSQTSGMKIHSNGQQDIDILAPPPSDPFKAPRVTLNRLISYRPDADLGHRRVSSGVVIFAVPGRFFYLLDQEACVRVDSAEARVAPGDLVEVAGFIETSRVLASFSEALVRKIGRLQVGRKNNHSFEGDLELDSIAQC